MVKFTMFRDIIQRCSAKSAATLPMLNTARIGYYGGRSIDADEKKSLNIHFRYYHMEVNLGRTIRAEFFSKTLARIFLPRIGFHMVGLIVVENMLT